jgi:hypothetical protein
MSFERNDETWEAMLRVVRATRALWSDYEDREPLTPERRIARGEMMLDVRDALMHLLDLEM